MVFTWPMSRQVVGCLIAHDFSANYKLLDAVLVQKWSRFPGRVHTLRFNSSSALGPVMFAVLRLVLVVPVGSNFLELF
jgi:hypothetical protein